MAKLFKGSETTKTGAALLEKAKSLGMEVITPEPNEIFIDIDSPEDLEFFNTMFERYKERLELTEYTTEPSPNNTPGHCHIIVKTVKNITEEKRLILQAVLGSDREKELLGLINYIKDEQPSTVLFRKIKTEEK